MKGHETGSTKFGSPDREHTLLDIKIIELQIERFRDAQPGDAEQTQSMTPNGLVVLSFLRERKHHGVELRESVFKLSLVWSLSLGLLAAAEPRDLVAAERPDRLTREAIALFRSVLKHKPGEL